MIDTKIQLLRGVNFCPVFFLHSEWPQTVFGFRWMLVQWGFLDIAQMSTFAGSQLVDDPLKVDPLYDLLTCRPIDPTTTELSHISSPWDGDQVEWCHQWWLNTLLTCWPTDTPLYYWHITHNDPFWPIWGKHCWHLNLKFNLILFVKNQCESPINLIFERRLFLIAISGPDYCTRISWCFILSKCHINIIIW